MLMRRILRRNRTVRERRIGECDGGNDDDEG